MSSDELFHLVEWRKSSFSGGGGTGGGNCVEVAFGDGVVAARDSKFPDSGMLTVPAERWSAFLDGLRAGRFRR
ncbi:uncharacterized protein DUF397 [Halopolyspora algeriensis]|uniref:Uncharacterized protein DUF397 n=1 Tax=Halopolyspora algeriensis TaxID=1500506 RepID=A0A368VH77_9ACTN|nr:DUF397 domain-containing protein [Halopolyspora algeriensis]RCW39545.1 uncharacterized protein DUF397 [Halopolyspora algeriensis]TQM56142.1 uncharacterized protein DUF397 [Halopolyspora algeriensis]